MPPNAATLSAIFAQSSLVPPAPARIGISASAGITAISWNSSTEKPSCPLRCGSCPSRASAAAPWRWKTSPEPTPPITAACQAKCVRYSNAPSTAAVINTAGAGAEDRTPQLPQLAGVQLQTDDEHQEHHAQLGEVQDLVDVANEAQSPGRWRCRRSDSPAPRRSPATGDRHRHHRGEQEQ